MSSVPICRFVIHAFNKDLVCKDVVADVDKGVYVRLDLDP